MSLTSFILSILLTVGGAQLQPAAHGRLISIVAGSDDRFELPGVSGNTLFVKAGEPLVLRIDARAGASTARDGAVHSLVIPALRDQGWDIRLKVGLQDVALSAPSTPGEYWIQCTVYCGPQHAGMRLRMVVKP